MLNVEAPMVKRRDFGEGFCCRGGDAKILGLKSITAVVAAADVTAAKDEDVADPDNSSTSVVEEEEEEEGLRSVSDALDDSG